MDKKVITECKKYPIDSASLLTFISVETGGYGFDQKTGKILIQFEPLWFKKLAPKAPNGIWASNKVSVQSKEWIAFNDAFAKDKEAAMKATSIGLPQIMGFHYDKLGFKTVKLNPKDEKTQLETLAVLETRLKDAKEKGR